MAGEFPAIVSTEGLHHSLHYLSTLHGRTRNRDLYRLVQHTEWLSSFDLCSPL